MRIFRAKWLTIAAAVIIVGAAVFFFTGNGQEKVAYRTDKVDRGDIVVNISATGTLNAVTTVQVGAQISGTIARLYADFNSVVKEGDLLAQLDPTFLEASVNEQQANFQRATAELNEAQRNVDRTSQLFGRSMVSQADMDAAQTAVESARAGLKQAQATLDRARVNLQFATIRAPISGVVISRNVDVGQTVAASLQAPTLFAIANDLRQMQVQASVDEADIGNVKIGQAVTFRVDAYPEETFEGKVSQVRLAPVITQNVVTYTVIIDVANPGLLLMPGMTATVSVEVAKKENALRVPLAALHFSPNLGGAAVAPVRGASRTDSVAGQGNSPLSDRVAGGPPKGDPSGGSPGRVWILKAGRPQPVSVVRGIQNTRLAELLQGNLQEGDEVIIGSNSTPSTVTPTQSQNPLMPRMPGGRH